MLLIKKSIAFGFERRASACLSAVIGCFGVFPVQIFSVTNPRGPPYSHKSVNQMQSGCSTEVFPRVRPPLLCPQAAFGWARPAAFFWSWDTIASSNSVILDVFNLDNYSKWLIFLHLGFLLPRVTALDSVLGCSSCPAAAELSFLSP